MSANRIKSITLKCQECFKEFHPLAGRGKTSKYCSHKCYSISLINKSSLKKGRKYPHLSGENNYLWKGQGVGYGALHSWVRRHRGKPTKCEICGVSSSEKRLQWANKSGKYLRNLNDFRPLCPSCHKKFDYKPETGIKISLKNKGRLPNSGSFKKGNSRHHCRVQVPKTEILT
jgi:hypothetical protein